MEVDRPAPGEELNPGKVTVPRLAATVILLRGETDQLEVLLVRRNPDARFMGGAWVFPGGAVDREEGEGDAALRAAAVRELAEEAGIEIDRPDALVPFARWITPAEVRIRFDTWFYLAPAPAGAQPAVDGAEIVDARWYQPAAALEAARERRAVPCLSDDQAARAADRLPVRPGADRARPGPRDPPDPATGAELG